MTERMLALGDSISCGEGVGIHIDIAHTWVGLLADALGTELDLLARSGCRVADVRAEQLPVAVARPAPLAGLLVGLNDVIRAGFDPAAVRADLMSVVDGLRAADMTVLLVRLHAPTALVPLPAPIRSRLIERVSVINNAIDSARAPGVVILDMAEVPALRYRGGWAVDRLHPGPAGHLAMAAAATALLSESGFPSCAPLVCPAVLPGHTKRAEVRWLIRHGAPYLIRHVPKMALPIGAVIADRAR